MKLVVDANVVISALVADSKTRELIVTLDPDLLTPAFVHDEIENYEDLIVEKSGMEPERVAQFVDLLFQYIEVVPVDEFHPAIEEADAAISDIDPDGVLYLACAIATDTAIWSDDSDFDEQDVVERYSTSDVIPWPKTCRAGPPGATNGPTQHTQGTRNGRHRGCARTRYERHRGHGSRRCCQRR